MNNEPVAWMDKESGVVCKEVYATEMPNNLIPLYTHPVKEPTDEEILFIADKVDIPDEPDTKDLIEFARAILRKAQEK